MVFYNATIEIALVSIAITIIARLLQGKLVDKKAQKLHQAKMKENQKRISELMKKGDTNSKKEAERLQNETLQSMNAVMQGNMKYMLFSMPLFLVFFAIISALYGKVMITLPFPLPIFHGAIFGNLLSLKFGAAAAQFEITSKISWLWWYIYSAAIAGIIISAIMNVLEKRKGEAK